MKTVQNAPSSSNSTSNTSIGSSSAVANGTTPSPGAQKGTESETSSDSAGAAGGGEAAAEDDSVLLGLNAMMLGIIGGSLCCCCGGGGVGLYMKKKGSSLTVAPGDSDPDKAGKRAGIIARANERFAAKQSVQDKAKAAKNEKVEAIKDKAKAWTVETLDVTYDNTQEGDRATWPDIIGACNEANPDNKLAKGDRIIGVEADEASVVESKIVLEVQEDLSVTPGKANEAEDKAVLEKLQEKKSFQIKVERDKATPAEASEEANGEAAPDAETDEEAKARLADGKAATKVGGGFLSGLKAKGAKKAAGRERQKDRKG
jgi:hypothetical protein